MLIYPMACELSGLSSVSNFKEYIKLSEKDPRVEYDIDISPASKTGFHQLAEIAQMATEKPDDFYPGTIKAITEVIKESWKHPRVGPQTETIYDIPKNELL